MDDDLIDPAVQRLVDGHPTLFGGEPPRVSSDLPAGWHHLVDSFCTALEGELGDDAHQHFQVAQIKEKLGTLRFYYRFVRDEADEDDKPAGGSFEASDPGRPTDELRARVRALVDVALLESESTCLKCGAAGALRNVDGYLTTLCDPHHQAAITRQDRPDAER